MQVCAHQAVSLALPLIAQYDVPEFAQERASVFGLSKQPLSACPTRAHVMDGAGEIHAGFACHDGRLRRGCALLCAEVVAF